MKKRKLMVSILAGFMAFIMLLGLILGQAGCLVLGWLWLRQFTAVAFFPATLPFLLPDIFKLALAWLISRRLRRGFPS